MFISGTYDTLTARGLMFISGTHDTMTARGLMLQGEGLCS